MRIDAGAAISSQHTNTSIGSGLLLNGSANITQLANSNHSSGDDGCHLMNTYGVVVQLILAFLAFSTLILKWRREPADERRSGKVWLADTTKQIVGASVVHSLNVLVSSLNTIHDPCTWYLINFVLDCTVGLVLIFAVLATARIIGRLRNWPSLNSGEYGQPFRWRYWLIQCSVYILAMLVEKGSVLGFVQAKFWTKVANVLLPIHNKKVRVALVMLVVPLLFNSLQFWVVDNILKRRQRKKAVAEVGDNSELKETLLTGDSPAPSTRSNVSFRLPGTRKYSKLAASEDSDAVHTASMEEIAV